MSRIALVVALVALGLAALSPSVGLSGTVSDESDVKRIALGVTWANIRGQYGRVWHLLHPRYQRVTTRAFWESCQRKRARQTSGVEWLSVRATDAYDDRVTLPLLGSVKVLAVSMEARVDYLGVKRTIRDTIYYTKVGPEWRGLWKPETYRAYKARRCPGN